MPRDPFAGEPITMSAPDPYGVPGSRPEVASESTWQMWAGDADANDGEGSVMHPYIQALARAIRAGQIDPPLYRNGDYR